MPKIGITIFLLAILAFGVYEARRDIKRYFFEPRISDKEIVTQTPTLTEDNSLEGRPDLEVVANNLSIPWEIVFLSSGDMLVTERTGTLVRVNKDTNNRIQVDGVRHVGEGGLLGMTLHPDFEQNNYIYLYLTSYSDGVLENRIERYKLENDTVSDREVIIDGIKGASNHDGGRIEFGPDGLLYVTTGDAEVSSLAQDTNSLNGKILRINDDGSIPPDNPFGNAVWSYGHRNPQGLAWDNEGRLWSSEHGPSGVQTGNDEINLIEKGVNYGWPEIKGTQTKDGMRSPIIESGRSDTWAPGDVEIIGNKLYFTGLRGETLYTAEISGSNLVNFQRNLTSKFGRLRAVKANNDYVYLSTSNLDGRGEPRQDDDRIIGINLDILK